MKRTLVPFGMGVVALLILDQVTKALVRGSLVEGQSVSVIPRVFDLTLVYNKGIAFGLMQGAGILLAPLAIVVAVAAAMGYAKSAEKERLFRFGMTLLAAGALGNLIDRLFMGGKVTDFIDIKIIHVFNVADACITVAAAILVLHWLTEIIRQPAKEVNSESSVGE